MLYGTRQIHTLLESTNVFVMIFTSVPDPWHIGTDPDSQIRTYLWPKDPDTDPALFVSDLKMPTKINLFLFLCLFLFEGTFTSFFKDKKS